MDTQSDLSCSSVSMSPIQDFFSNFRGDEAPNAFVAISETEDEFGDVPVRAVRARDSMSSPSFSSVPASTPPHEYFNPSGSSSPFVWPPGSSSSSYSPVSPSSEPDAGSGSYSPVLLPSVHASGNLIDATASQQWAAAFDPNLDSAWERAKEISDRYDTLIVQA